ncbi:hypothetical protein CALCODRAFT_496029 [Calocera cornea HHB12733]|uniref:CFEM domain-containing protein n=1 Tax=Calocera cornea HHB12733 TaxID=1353952 RepID=A0A165G5E3_9BASI|nr:hypothetical protein CALCODRAFT_496029 [Calocera cornea HHB12733]
MRFTTAVLLLGASLLALSQTLPSNLPPCVTLCITVKESEAGSLAPGATNIYEYCQSANFITAFQNCLNDNCNATDAAAGVQIGQQICAAATSSFLAQSSSIAAAANSSAAAATSAFSSISAGSTSSSAEAASSRASSSSGASTQSGAAAGSSSSVASQTSSSLSTALSSLAAGLSSTASGISASAGSAISSLGSAASSKASGASTSATGGSGSAAGRLEVPTQGMVGIALCALGMALGAMLL